MIDAFLIGAIIFQGAVNWYFADHLIKINKRLTSVEIVLADRVLKDAG